MKIRWLGVVMVLLAVLGVLVTKQRTHRVSQAPAASVERPSVLLVADLREADQTGDACAEIIRAVREANKRGIRVQELMPGSSSELVRRYRILTVPTVIVLSDDGGELARFEGENQQTVVAVRTRLAALSGSSK